MKTKEKTKKKITASDLGKMGGTAVSKKLGSKGMSKLGKKGAKARWGK